jgi:hypothetical protein
VRVKSHGDGGVLLFVQARKFLHSKFFEGYGCGAPLSHPFFRRFSFHEENFAANWDWRQTQSMAFVRAERLQWKAGVGSRRTLEKSDASSHKGHPSLPIWSALALKMETGLRSGLFS